MLLNNTKYQRRQAKEHMALYSKQAAGLIKKNYAIKKLQNNDPKLAIRN